MKRRDLLKAGALGLMGCAAAPAVKANEEIIILDETGKLFKTALEQLDAVCVISVIKIHAEKLTDTRYPHHKYVEWTDRYPWLIENLRNRLMVVDGVEKEMYKLQHADVELMKKSDCRAKLWYTLYTGRGEKV